MQQEKAKKKHVFAVDRIGSSPFLANSGEDSTCPTQFLGVEQTPHSLSTV
jgi:hypothetical protein